MSEVVVRLSKSVPAPTAELQARAGIKTQQTARDQARKHSGLLGRFLPGGTEALEFDDFVAKR